ncbi:glycosyltransferase family 39 protein [Micromonospora sp. C28ISP2-4]|uniref:glycosyltransferase family 39 protein n=1 Tax=Micromonospora sp. C28ISP2-4 TaxID=3059523 RepID=UPI002674F5AD|nr:glycosyltransferase family 39 protein [Micromonospora sp. C28ISP2-4]MDO3682718.1 glycosyltransferase family 39 protein [Micromonospora sp. C28ISP2-4]
MSVTRPAFSPAMAPASATPVPSRPGTPAAFVALAWERLSRSPYWSVAGLLVAFGAVLRIRQWAYARSFWSDELYVAHNIRERGYLDLLQPLAFSQSAPPGWLWLERFAFEQFGDGERALRLVPLLFGLALLPLVAWLGRALLPPLAALAALLLVAVAPFLIGYSNELKQYSAEAFGVTLVIGLALLLVRTGPTWAGSAVFWSVAAVAAFVSTLSIPVTGALGVLLAGYALSRPDRPPASRWRDLGRFLAPAPAWGVVALVVYVLFLAPGLADPQLAAYWRAKSIYPAHSLTDLAATVQWLAATYRSLATVPFVAWSAWVVVPLLVLGTAAGLRRLSTVAVLVLLTPLAAGLAGAAVSVYPFNGRLALYAVPACLLLAALAVAPPPSRAGLPARVRWVVGVVLLLALAVPQLATAVVATVHPARAFAQGGGANAVDYRGALSYLEDKRRPGDLVLATTVSWNAQAWYGPAADAYVVAAGPGGCPKQTVSTLLPGRSRVWLFQATDWADGANRDVIVRLGGTGVAVTERQFSGARVVRFDLAAGVTKGSDICLVPPPNGARVR